MQRSMEIIVAATTDGGIGLRGALPWRLPSDMAYFRKTTTTARVGFRNAVIMGRKTYESIPATFRPLKDRLNVVLSRTGQIEASDSVLVCPSLSSALSSISALPSIDRIFIAGGRSVYEEALVHPNLLSIHLTLIFKHFETDVKMPPIPACFQKLEFPPPLFFEEEEGSGKKANTSNSDETVTTTTTTEAEEKKVKYQIVRLVKMGSSSVSDTVSEVSDSLVSRFAAEHEEMQYLNLVRKILAGGAMKGDRTGTGTLSLFGAQLRFSLRNNVLPLLTTKRVFWRGVAEELIWFVRGSTNANLLRDKDIHIWDGNASREYLDSIGLNHREEGDLGPVYGFQWRHFGAEYKDMHSDYTGQGIDQLADVIDKIKNKPNDRRIILTAWNPAALPSMALPPCHLLAQFFVDQERGELSCQMYQRSADMGLGVPFNIASYSLLTILIAHVTGLKPGDFIHSIGDAHIYLNHIEALREQIQREPRPFPTLRVNPLVTDINKVEFSDLTLENYNPLGKLAMQMSV